jgi:hypothetical protein
MKIGRRSLVHGLLLALLEWTWPGGWARRRASSAAAPAPSSSSSLTAAEIDALLAFAGILAVGRRPSMEERADITQHLDDRVRQSDSHLPIYRATVRRLDEAAGRPFADLDVASAVALVARRKFGSPRIDIPETGGEPTDDDRAIRTRIGPDLVAAFYRSAGGWAVVGYDAFPGRCGDLRQYVTFGAGQPAPPQRP